MTACQSSTHPVGGPPAAFSLTFRGAPVRANGTTLPGSTWTELACRVCATKRQDAVRADGGNLVEAEMLAPEPTGLDALAQEVSPTAPDDLGQVVAMANGLGTVSAALAVVEWWLERTAQTDATVNIPGVEGPVPIGHLVGRALGIARPLNAAVEGTPWLKDRLAVALPWEG